jgi:hypothetical protein
MGIAKRVKRKTLEVPIPLFDRISRRAAKTGFSSESDYATYILREALIGIEEEEARKNKTPSKEASQVFAKLRALGYI